MDSVCRTRSLSSILKDIEKEKISFKHKLQREEGQWNKKVKTDLIDSILRHYPVNPSYGIKTDTGIAIIDGVQRLSTIRDFLTNKFALSDDMEPVTINGEEKNLAGLKFKKLDEDTKDELTKAEIQIYELMDCTEKDVREIFRRQNAGKNLNGKQLRVVYESDEFGSIVYSLASHPFMNKIMTKTQKKNGTARDVIRQAFMLISSNQEQEFTSFRNTDMDAYVEEYADKYIDKADTLKEAMDRLNESIETIKIPSTSVPMVLYSAYRVQKDKKSFTKLVDIITDFSTNYNSNEEYKKFLQSGTSSQEKVRGRFEWWRNKIKTL